MRTLKKSLALVLVIAMVASFGVIGASADFADVEDTNDYYEAIQVLSGLGIIEGTDDEANTFEPEGTLTREQAAKIVSYVVLGDKAIIVEPADSAPFDDVAANRWSAGFVAYCKNKGIVEGEEEGIFNPEGKLSTAAFTKMLLVAIGFDADANGLNGSNWVLNTAICAEDAGLYINSIGVSTKDITRAQACELALAALQYSASGSTPIFVVYDEASGKELYSGTNENLAYAAYIKYDGAKIKTTYSTVGSLGDANYGLSKISAPDPFGRIYTQWTNGEDGDDQIVYAEFAPEALKSYNTATTYGKIVSDLGYTSAKTEVTLNIRKNGGATEEAKAYKYTETAIGGTGTSIQVYKTVADTYSVIVVDTYVTTLAKGDIVAATKATATKDAEKAYIVLERDENDDPTLTYKTDAFAKGDTVLYTVADGKVASVVKADAFSGSVTATAASKGYIKVDGAEKYLSANNVDDCAIGVDAGYKVSEDSYTYYTDFYGNIIHAVKGKVADIDTDYIYVIATAAVEAQTDRVNLFETTAGAAAVAQAKVINLETGKIEVVNLGIVLASDGNYYYANPNGSASDKVVTTESSNVPAIWSYATLADNSIVLVADETANLKTVKLAKGSASVEIPGLYANSATVLKVVEYTLNSSNAIASATVSTSTGIANFPGTTNDRASYSAIVTDNGSLISEILVVQKKGDVVQSVNYAIYGGEGEVTANGQAYLFFVNGKAENYIVANGFSTSAKAGDVVALTFSNGKVSVAEKLTDTDAQIAAGIEVLAVESNFFVDTNGNIYYFADSYEVVDSNEDYALSTLEAGDVIDVYGTTAVAFIVK